jgi:hypothetical protein
MLLRETAAVHCEDHMEYPIWAPLSGLRAYDFDHTNLKSYISFMIPHKRDYNVLAIQQTYAYAKH